MPTFGEMTSKQRNAYLKDMISKGLMREIAPGCYEFTGKVDLKKLAEFEKNYAERFNELYQERRKKEIEAEKKWWKQGPWYFCGLEPEPSLA